MTTSPTCTWTDAERGFREEVSFVNDAMFTVTVTPLDEPRGLTLICPPLADDLVRNYRREVVLARRLARQGVASQRFQYRSTGNSLGDAQEMGWAQLVDDAANVRHLGAAARAVGSAWHCALRAGRSSRSAGCGCT